MSRSLLKQKIAPEISTSAVGSRWRIRMENVFTGKRHTGIVTGKIENAVRGLAVSGWIVQMHYPVNTSPRR